MSLISSITRDSRGRFVRTIPDKFCIDCGIKISRGAERCNPCSRKHIHKTDKDCMGFKRGYTPWNKGKMGLFKMPKDAVEKIRNRMLGTHLSQSTKEKISKANSGRKHPNRKKPEPFTEEHKRNLSKGIRNSKKFHEVLFKRLKEKGKSKIEIRFEELLNKLNLPYKYVGDGSLIICNKNPDFVHNTKKIILEVFYVSHKQNMGQAKGIGIDEWMKQRYSLFKKDGWETIFFNENEVNEKTIMEKLYELD